MTAKVLIAILARDKEATLPLYLKCLENLDYDKSNIILYIRTNDNADNTTQLLQTFVDNNKDKYAHIEFDSTNIDPELTRHHDWNYNRFKVLAAIRNASLLKALEYNCDYYFVADCDNFILPHTLKSLISYGLPVISPMLENDSANLYSNFHYDVDDNGYFKDNPHYLELFSRLLVGLVQVKVVHCTYLIRADVIHKLTYDDGSGRYEYVIFSDSARKRKIPQYLDNTKRYGIITFKTKNEEMENFERDFYNPLLETCK